MEKRDWYSFTLPLLQGCPRFQEVFLAFGNYKVTSAPKVDPEDLLRRPRRGMDVVFFGTNCKIMPDWLPERSGINMGNAAVEQIGGGGPAVFVVRGRIKSDKEMYGEILGVLDLQTGKNAFKTDYFLYFTIIKLAWFVAIWAALFFPVMWLLRSPNDMVFGGLPQGIGLDTSFTVVKTVLIGLVACAVAHPIALRLALMRMRKCLRKTMSVLETQRGELWDRYQTYHEAYVNDETAIERTGMQGFALH